LLQLLVFADVELVHLLVLPQPNSLIDSHEVHCLFARIKAFNFVAGLQSRMDTWYYVLQLCFATTELQSEQEVIFIVAVGEFTNTLRRVGSSAIMLEQRWLVDQGAVADSSINIHFL